MLNFNSALIFSENPKALVEFYKKVFQTDPSWSGGDFSGFQVGSGHIVIGPHDKVKGKSGNPERMMLNFEAADLKAEFERVKGLGATVVQEPYHPGEDDKDPNSLVATFADPDGNYFQIMSPMKME